MEASELTLSSAAEQAVAVATCLEHCIRGFVSPSGYALSEPQLAG